MGKIGLENCRFFAQHGYYETEKKEGNHFEINLIVDYNVSQSANSDNLDEGLNYERLYVIVKDVMEGKSVNLLEHLAYKIIQAVKSEFQEINGIKVRVAKLNPPITGNIKSVWVELEE